MRRLPSVLGHSVLQVPLCPVDASALPATALAPTSEDHVSNPDFPGPYWQDKPEPYDGGGHHRNGDSDGYGRSRNGYDQAGDAWPGEWTRNAAPSGSGAGSRHARRGRNGRSGRRDRGGPPVSDNGSPYDPNGARESYGAAANSGGRRGRREQGYAGRGDRSTGRSDRSTGRSDRSSGRVSRAGYVSSDYGSAQNG